MPIENILSLISTIAACASALIAASSLCRSAKTQKEVKIMELKRATIEAFNELQHDVLDKFAPLSAKNAKLIVEEMQSSEQARQAYVDYRTLIARLDHFSIGVYQGIYDYDLVKELAGDHLVYLLPKIKPIIDYANRRQTNCKYYGNYMRLVKRLQGSNQTDSNTGEYKE